MRRRDTMWTWVLYVRMFDHCSNTPPTDSPLGMVSRPPLEYALAAGMLLRPLRAVGGCD